MTKRIAAGGCTDTLTELICPDAWLLVELP